MHIIPGKGGGPPLMLYVPFIFLLPSDTVLSFIFGLHPLFTCLRTNELINVSGNEGTGTAQERGFSSQAGQGVQFCSIEAVNYCLVNLIELIW